MAIPRPSASAWLASAVLGIVVLFVFFVLQDYGPEATVRKFHQAVAEGNAREISYLTYPSGRTPQEWPQATQTVVLFLREVMKAQPKVQLYAVTRHPTTAAAVVTYLFPPTPYGVPEPINVVWIVTKVDSVWKIDTRATVEVTPLAGDLRIPRR